MAADLDFDELVERYYRPLYQFAFSLSRSSSDAGDLTQQTFLLWARKGHQLRDSTKVKTWLFTTLHREFLNARRHLDRFPHQELSAAEAALPHVPPPPPGRLDTAALLNALARLDQLFQAPVVLFYLRDLSYKEIAEILDIPIGTVKSRLARALAQLQTTLSETKPLFLTKKAQ